MGLFGQVGRPTFPRSTVVSLKQEAIIVAFRKHTLLPLDDCLYALQITIPQCSDKLQCESRFQIAIRSVGLGRVAAVGANRYVLRAEIS
jgi:hypothetical protein